MPAARLARQMRRSRRPVFSIQFLTIKRGIGSGKFGGRTAFGIAGDAGREFRRAIAAEPRKRNGMRRDWKTVVAPQEQRVSARPSRQQLFIERRGEETALALIRD